jgi:NhaA family Na+:H+ antiporter
VEPISAGLAVPLFALFAAGVPIDGRLLGRVVSSAVPLGIILGLLIGKPVGVLAGSWLTIRFTRARLRRGLHRRDMVAAGQLTGIGFTVSLLICELAFHTNPELLDEAKIAVLLGSAASALLGGLAMAVRDRRHRSARRDNASA